MGTEWEDVRELRHQLIDSLLADTFLKQVLTSLDLLRFLDMYLGKIDPQRTHWSTSAKEKSNREGTQPEFCDLVIYASEEGTTENAKI